MADKKCPFCAELIKREAIKCKHCGSEIPPSNTSEKKPDGCVQYLGYLLIAILVLASIGKCSNSEKSPEQKCDDGKQSVQDETDMAKSVAEKAKIEKMKVEAAAAYFKRQLDAKVKKYGKRDGAFGDFEIYGLKSTFDEHYIDYIVGTVVNNSNRDYSYVQINAKVEDPSGAVLDTPWTNIAGLESQGAWKFKIMVHIDDDQKWQYSITDVKGR